MHEWTDGLAGGFMDVDDALAREFDALLVENSALAFRVAFSVLRHRQDAEDVAQEAFAKFELTRGSAPFGPLVIERHAPHHYADHH